MKAKLISTLALTLCVGQCIYGQQEIPVNLYTGVPSIFIPVHTLTDHDLSETIGLSYDVNSINLNRGTSYGGWELEAGGQVTRKVRGLPDDFMGSGADTRTGWLYNSNSSGVLSFPNTSTAGSCANQDDFNYIINLDDKTDTEPDLFSFSIGGYSGKFVFDNSGTIQLIPYQDLKIEVVYTNYPSDKTIQGWTITTTDGIIYSITNKCTTVREITKTADQEYVSLFDRLYKMYRLPVTFTSAWMLTSTTSPTGAKLTYTYKTPANGKSTKVDPWNVKLFNPTGANSIPGLFNLMSDNQTTTSLIIDEVSTTTGLRVICDPEKGIRVFDAQVSTTNPYKTISLGYDYGILTSLTMSDGFSCIQQAPYTFTYQEWSGDYFTTGSQDFWGFYNGNNPGDEDNLEFYPTIYVYPNEPAKERYRLNPIPGYTGANMTLGTTSYRSPNPFAITSGTLSKITYPTGGTANFVFEANTYYDARAGIDQTGGGVRIKSITYKEDVNPAAEIVKIFSYTAENGKSSGQLISMPSYVVPMWQQKIPTNGVTTTAHSVSYGALSGTDPWVYLLAVVSFDVSDQDATHGSAVGYSHVTVSRPGNGKAVYDYLVPVAYGDGATGSNPTDWLPTTTKYARPTTCPGMSIIPGFEDYGYRVFPQSEYDYERGLEWKKSEFNEAGTQVRLTQTAYQYLYRVGATQPVQVVGLAYDLYGNSENNSDKIFLYGRYSLLAGVAKVVLSKTVTTYDENNVSRNSTVVTQYDYTSNSHRFLNKVSTTLPDGTVYRNYVRYVPDYTTISSLSDTTSYMINQLQATNRTSVAIEQVSTVQYSGSSEKTTGASLVQFRPFTANKPLLRSQLVFRTATPVTNFTASSVDGSNNFHYDNRYEVTTRVNEYGPYDLPVSATGENGMTSGTLWDINQNSRYQVATFNGARSGSIAFSDFELITSSSFTVQDAFYGLGRTGNKGVHPYATLKKTVTKPSDVTHYLLSFWAKPPSGMSSLILTVTLTYNGTSPATNYTFNFDSSVSGYQYFTKLVDVTAISTSSFEVQIHGQSFSAPSGSDNSLLPVLDDIAFYPGHVQLSSTTYAPPFGPSSVTDASGNSLFTTYDALGRTKLVIDQDLNVRSRNDYLITNEVLKPLTASNVAINGSRIPGWPLIFIAQSNPCYSGTTYAWDFHDGNGFVGAGTDTTSPSFAYPATGTYPVTLKVTDGTLTSIATINVQIVSSLSPLLVNLTASEINGNAWTTLTATSSETSQPVMYQWFIRPTGSSAWSISNVTTNTLTQKILSQTSWDFKCVASTSDGRTDSKELTVASSSYLK